MSYPQYILSVYANDKLDSLTYLKKEHNEILKLLDSDFFQSSTLTYEAYMSATREPLRTKLQNRRQKLRIFHFSGHANGKRIDLADLGAEGEDKFTKKQLLSYLHPDFSQHIKLVFLNGCNTKVIAEELVGQGVPIVIGTDSEVSDKLAYEVSLTFFKILSKHALKPLREILVLFKNELKNLASGVDDSKKHQHSFTFDDEMESETEASHNIVAQWFILYGKGLSTEITEESHVQEALDWIPYDEQDDLSPDDNLPNENSLPAQEKSVEEVDKLIKQFNFSDQRIPVRNRLDNHNTGFFYAHGNPKKGLAWITKNLKWQYFFEDYQSLRIELNHTHLNLDTLEAGQSASQDEKENGKIPLGIQKLSLDVWRKVAHPEEIAPRTFPYVKDQVLEIANILVRRLSTTQQPIALKLIDPGDIIAQISNELLSYFLQPLDQALNKRITPIVRTRGKRALKEILVFVVSESSLESDTVTNMFQLIPGISATNNPIEILPAIDREVDVQELNDWKVLLENPFDIPPDLTQVLLENWDDIESEDRPMDVLDTACGWLGFSFSYRPADRIYEIKPDG